ncbi:hypothetical protein C5B94_03850 [Clavibacter michiganensis]|uniref:hypothetical protein n=1 Tax=Clavibacter michiganensis TaxID=28447 RepID=UPI000CE860DF|nr:hypothetical protein [Clavibacter michiganensis]PPF56063.1 hypothetical protein C5B94_03850 [Clavibacter michiganensis]
MRQITRTGSSISRNRPEGIAQEALVEDFDVMVKVELPREHFRRLAVAADQRDTDVSVLVREIVRRQLERTAPAASPHREPPAVITREMRRNLRNLTRDGYSDTRIADVLDVPVSTVVEMREQQGLDGRPARVAS